MNKLADRLKRIELKGIGNCLDTDGVVKEHCNY